MNYIIASNKIMQKIEDRLSTLNLCYYYTILYNNIQRVKPRNLKIIRPKASWAVNVNHLTPLLEGLQKSAVTSKVVVPC